MKNLPPSKQRETGGRWSIRLGTLFGVEVYLHLTFLLLLAVVAIGQWNASRDAAKVANALAFYISLFGCVLLHEFGHVLAARRYGIQTQDVTLLPIGGVARLERIPSKPSEELVVALAGPLVNVVIAVFLWIGMSASGAPPILQDFTPNATSWLTRLFVANVSLVAFNLLPAFPMDGGRVLRALLSLKIHPVRATQWASNIGKIMAVGFGIVGILSNPMLVFIALFVWIGATQEAATTRTRALLQDVPVADAMLTDFIVLPAQGSLDDAGRALLAASQHDFPVVDGAQVVGILRHTDLFSALREFGAAHPIARAMQRNFITTTPSDSLLDVIADVQSDESGCTTVPVLLDGRMVGLLTAENVGEWVMLRTALLQFQTLHPQTPPVLPRRPTRSPTPI